MILRISIGSLLLVVAILAIAIADSLSQVSQRDRILQYVNLNSQCHAILNLHGEEASFVETFSQTRVSTARPLKDAAINDDASWLTKLQYEHSYDIEQLSITIHDQAQARRWSELLSQRTAPRGIEALTIHLKDSQLPFDFDVLAQMDDVKVLSLTNVKIDRQLLDTLLGMNDLEIIDLSSCVIVDFNQLICLARMPNLAWLKIDGSQLSDEAVKRLRRQLPNTYLTI